MTRRLVCRTLAPLGAEMAILLVDDDALFRKTTRDTLALEGETVLEAASVKEALARLEQKPSVVFVDVLLPDGTGIDIVEAALRCRPVPRIVAISGAASSEQAFRLAQLGVRGYLTKPITAEELLDVLRASSRPLEMNPIQIASAVGNTPIHEVQGHVRRVMLEQALALTGWNITGAARLLGVTRQAVQQMSRELGVRAAQRVR